MMLTTQAIIFAAQAHDGAKRRGSEVPYIVHPMEAAAIAAALTDDEEVIAAAVLHDVIEDCGITEQALCERFGQRVAQLVLTQTHVREGDPRETWEARKQETVARLEKASRAEKIVALSDKLSNMRAIARDYNSSGEAMFARFHQQDREQHAWYYRSCTALLEEELGGTQAWRELSGLVDAVFAGMTQTQTDGGQAHAL